MKHYLIAITLISTLVSPAASARLTSISAVEKVNVNGQEQKQFYAICGTNSLKPKLIYKADQNQWCDSVVLSMCSKDKLEAAQSVCSRSYAKALKTADKLDSNQTLVTAGSDASKPNTQALEADNIARLKKEALDIEDKMIEIKAARIELRKRELELLKQ